MVDVLLFSARVHGLDLTNTTFPNDIEKSADDLTGSKENIHQDPLTVVSSNHIWCLLCIFIEDLGQVGLEGFESIAPSLRVDANDLCLQ